MSFRRHQLSLLLVTALATSSEALAEDPPKSLTLSGGATVTSDYRFRGISQTDRNIAVQGTATLAHSSGFYVSFWGSSVSDYVTARGRSHQELDLIVGFKKTVAGTTFDTGLLYYLYPGTGLPGDRSASNFAEPYFSVAHILGPVTAKATVSYAPKQRALAFDQIGPSHDNLYLAGDLSAAIPKSPVALTAHVGHTTGPSWLSIGRQYTDWSLGGTYSYKALTLSLQYVDTDGAFVTPSGRNAARAGLVASLGASF